MIIDVDLVCDICKESKDKEGYFRVSVTEIYSPLNPDGTLKKDTFVLVYICSFPCLIKWLETLSSYDHLNIKAYKGNQEYKYKEEGKE